MKWIAGQPLGEYEMHGNTMLRSRYLAVGFMMLVTAWTLVAQTNKTANPPASTFRVVLNSGNTNVFVQRSGASVWDPAYDGQLLNAGDRIQTRANTRIVLVGPDGATLRVGEFSDLEIQSEAESKSGLSLMAYRARLYFFHRGNPTDLKLRTRTAAAAVRGTEFNFQADEAGVAQIALTDGSVSLSNANGAVLLGNGEQGIASPGHPPTKTAVIEAVNIIQWCLYYPAILDLDDLRFETEAPDELKQSLARYREGDLLLALAACPAAKQPISDSETIYRSALLLAVGKAEESGSLLDRFDNDSQTQNDIGRHQRLARAIRLLIASVKIQPCESNNLPELATEWLAESYHRQSEQNLDGALEAARAATVRSPRFGFAWARVAELEFSFGHSDAATDALKKALECSPRNAQALALKGFLLAAKNKFSAAIESFNQVLGVDTALGNAWLGRGLCRIRRGDMEGGLEDLQIAVVVEPHRAILRSYLAKGFAQTHQTELAVNEFRLAKEIDPHDPTAWLYSALFNQEQSRVNSAIVDLEISKELNDNRALFRSKMLLDEDRAVRSANLARIYQDAGMNEVGLGEAARSVTHDYANDAAHLFISDSFGELRDPTRFNLRYETVWFNEWLLANLLAPVGAGRLPLTVSEQEYSRLFESDGLGLASSTTVRSDGQVRQLASQYGTFNNSSWAFDLDYQHNDGVRVNNGLARTEWYATIKQQLTPDDTVLLLTKYQDYQAGDNFQYYAPTNARPNFRFEEEQKPILLGGYRHQWAPGVHTMLLAGRLANEQRFSDQDANLLLLAEFPNGTVYQTDQQPFDVNLSSKLEIYTAEVNQIVQKEKFTAVFGGLWQDGKFDSSQQLTNTSLPPFLMPSPATAGSYSDSFHRLEGYGYLTLEPIERVWLTGGITYNDLEMPMNFRAPPIGGGTTSRQLWGPKAALIWNPSPSVTVRGMFSRSLGGVSLDESYRLEPTQLAGFPTAYRSVISESLVGSVAAPKFDIAGLGADLKLGPRTYLNLHAGLIESFVDRDIGVFRLDNGNIPYVPSTSQETLDYHEQVFGAAISQLVGENVALGLTYRCSRAELDAKLPEVPTSVLSTADQSLDSTLHRVEGHAIFNHSSGLFARGEAQWYHQRNSGFTPAQPGDDFMQFNISAGYRFAQRRGEVSIGVLNLTDQDYRLSPLTIYSELPRERVFFASFSFRF